jgi:hypothetical protein
VSSGNFIISQLLACSMQQLWSMIRAMQTIIITSIIEIPMPAHAMLFMKSAMTIAQIDVLDGAALYKKTFDFKQTECLTPNYEQFGIGDKNFIMNSGSYFLFIIAFFVINFTMFVINKIVVKNAHRPMCRRIGMKVYSP